MATLSRCRPPRKGRGAKPDRAGLSPGGKPHLGRFLIYIKHTADWAGYQKTEANSCGRKMVNALEYSRGSIERGETAAGFGEDIATSDAAIVRLEPDEARANSTTPTQTYRCYLLDESDRIRSFVEVVAPSDAQAVLQAKRCAKDARRPFELWRGHKIICRGDWSQRNAETPNASNDA